MDKIIKGYWKCQYCGTKDIDGLADVCPNCGKRKPENTKYYLKDIKEELTDAELEEAGISRAECDGKHKDWVCSYCNQLNNWSDETSAACSAPKTESEFEYGMRKRKAEDSGKDTTDLSETADIEEEDSVRWQDTGNDDNDFSSDHVNADTKHGFDWKKKLVAALGGCIPLFALLAFLFWPVKEEIRVSGFSWARNITVEEEKTFDESGWSVPTDGRVYDERVELKEYVTVLDHYETVYETRTRQVISHYDTQTSYVDNGNGTFTAKTTQVPVYKTEYYQEPVQKPVYRQQPVYDTRYYYEIDHWVNKEDYPSSGNDQDPYWNEDYTLEEKERDTKRAEEYFVHFDDGTEDELQYSEWIETSIGDGYLLTRNRLGMTYKSVPLEAD